MLRARGRRAADRVRWLAVSRRTAVAAIAQRQAVPVASVPMRFPSITIPEPEERRLYFALPEMTLPGPVPGVGVSPPIVLFTDHPDIIEIRDGIRSRDISADEVPFDKVAVAGVLDAVKRAPGDHVAGRGDRPADRVIRGPDVDAFDLGAGCGGPGPGRCRSGSPRRRCRSSQP